MEMDRRGVWLLLAAALAGGATGWLAGRWAGVSGALSALREEGVDTREVRWLDAEGRTRLTVGMPGGIAARYAGEGNPVVTILDEQGRALASFAVTPGALSRLE